MRVLIIDSNSFLQTVYQSDLHQQNIEVDLASNGLEGLDLLKKNIPNLIMLELILPRMNGFDFIEEVKRNKKFKNIPIIVFSELNGESDIKEVTDMGISKYLQKDNYSQKQVVEEILNTLMANM